MPGPPLGDTATVETAGFPWNIVLPIGLSLLGGIFGKSEEDQMMERAMNMRQIMRMLGMKEPYQSPYTPSVDTAVFNYLMRNLQRYGNFGFPADMQMDLSFLGDLTGGGMGKVRRKYQEGRTRVF